MTARRLIITMIAAICMLLPTSVTAWEAVQDCTCGEIGRTDNRPQWGDMGMDHLLVGGGQTTLTPPSPVRVASQGRRLAGGGGHAVGDSPEAAIREACVWHIVLRTTLLHIRWTRGYLYKIQCLRL